VRKNLIFFIWGFLFFLLKQSGLIFKSPVTTHCFCYFRLFAGSCFVIRPGVGAGFDSEPGQKLYKAGLLL